MSKPHKTRSRSNSTCSQSGSEHRAAGTKQPPPYWQTYLESLTLKQILLGLFATLVAGRSFGTEDLMQL